MSVDINLANYQAGQLRNYSLQLNGVVDSLKNYKSTIDINWQGNEVKLIDNAIDKINRRIQNLQQNMNSTANNIINSANQIRQEEIQAEQRRQVKRLEEERRKAAEQLAQQQVLANAKAKEEAAMKDVMDKINKVSNKTKKNKLIAKSKENGITADELEKYYKKIMGK